MKSYTQLKRKSNAGRSSKKGWKKKDYKVSELSRPRKLLRGLLKLAFELNSFTFFHKIRRQVHILKFSLGARSKQPYGLRNLEKLKDLLKSNVSLILDYK